MKCVRSYFCYWSMLSRNTCKGTLGCFLRSICECLITLHRAGVVRIHKKLWYLYVFILCLFAGQEAAASSKVARVRHVDTFSDSDEVRVLACSVFYPCVAKAFFNLGAVKGEHVVFSLNDVLQNWWFLGVTTILLLPAGWCSPERRESSDWCAI